MTLRFTVQGDDEAETAAGLRQLLTLGLRELMPPRELTEARWMARAVPDTTKAPVFTDRGPGASN